jgi:hypothetical protein
MRPFALIAALVLMVFAAYGLSPTSTNDDYCLADSAQHQWWPPGVRCEYAPSAERGTTPVQPDTANVAAFVVTLGVGVAFVLARRSQLALGAALIFGLAGLGATLVGWLQLFFFGCILGALAAYWLTRSVAATVLPAAALLIAFTVQFVDDVPLAWAAAVLVLMLLPQQVQGIRPAAGAPRPLSSI